MRAIANTDTLGDILTEPVYLVQLDFAPKLYLSSGPQANWDGKTWTESGVRVDRIQTDVLGRSELSISIGNLDLQMGVLVLNQPVNDKTAKVWLIYPRGSAGIVGPVLLADGIMDGSEVGEEVKIGIRSRGAYYGATPRISCGEPVFNHLPPSGTILKWGNQSYLLERR